MKSNLYQFLACEPKAAAAVGHATGSQNTSFANQLRAQLAAAAFGSHATLSHLTSPLARNAHKNSVPNQIKPLYTHERACRANATDSFTSSFYSFPMI